ncbi:helix-turn-helix domain-containing protein [Actinoalloteichus hymeniacidonis]|uniref:DNA binding protein with helix-turn-helix domain n=1 Tax=Actinoalloteichus hymeniacidonis TaxID=340345 RepID=A0AAC9HNX7_9PSEU|nr:helix-turn-helix transcriptional regulator [Actinoalloteichus hymeniacidonis]AOS62663.1 DNA binding protein with helix-turn-helix domain [Actinoalloteichus hymeniacidonis]MBB5909306.1 transcriptional regulator with XRE-family HTH domain [Actinoalloteichus hymeniacidonis]
MDEQKIVQRNLALQREWYGEPLGDRVRRLVVAYRISQAQLADVLGISAPMLSQVMSGRRAKIGNPAVLARLVMLERRALGRDVIASDREAIQRALDEVRNSRPTVARGELQINEGNHTDIVAQVLGQAASFDELIEAAELLGGRFPKLARVLRDAARD